MGVTPPNEPGILLATAADFHGYYLTLMGQIADMFASLDITDQRTATLLLRDLQREFNILEDLSAEWIEQNIPSWFTYGDEAAQQQLKGLGLSDFSAHFTQVHEGALATVIGTMKQEVSGAIAQTQRTLLGFVQRVKQSPLDQRLILADVAKGVALGQRTQRVASAIERTLAENAIMGRVTVGSRTMGLSDYASLLARTHLRVAYSRGTEARLSSNDIDLVIISTHNTECKVCGPLENKVFSISGKHPKYPPISAMPNEGCPVHPNCLHVENAFIEELASKEELQLAKIDPAAWPFGNVEALTPGSGVNVAPALETIH